MIGLRPEALVPMTECIFQGVIENVNADREEGLDSVPAPSHLLLFVHPFRDDLVDRGFGESGRYFEIYYETDCRSPASNRHSVPDNESYPAAYCPVFLALGCARRNELEPIV